MIPKFIRPFLWSYDTSALDLVQDKKRIITNVLNLGTQEATDWLFKTYSKEDIKNCLSSPLSGEWSDKSLTFWSFLMDIQPGQTKRVLK